MTAIALREPANRSRVNVHDAWELNYWSKLLRTSPDKLRRAVLLAGVMLTDVKMYLKRRAMPDD